MDPRQLRSQRRLHEAVLRLATTTPVTELTATAVAREAGVHRSTFYEHATSPEDLLRAALGAELDELRAALLEDAGRPSGEAMEEVTGQVLAHVERHAAVYRRGLAPDAGTGGLHAMLAEHFVGSLRALDDQGRLHWPDPVAGVDVDLQRTAAARFVALGTVGAIEAWLTADGPERATGVAAFVTLHRSLVPPWWARLSGG